MPRPASNGDASSYACRFFYIRRYYPPTWRSYFLPAKGLHINRFGIHIRGPPPRIPREEPPPYIFATEFGPHGRRRRRRGRQTVGATVGEGGARIGERDQDDMWDVDLVGGADGANGPAGTPALVRDELPRYFVDGGLPMYDVGDGSAAEEAERIRAEAAASGAAGADLLETLPTAAEYEAASRAARSHAAESGNAHAESQLDRARGEEGVDNNADGGAAYPPRPPPVARTTTGRSSILGAFTRVGNLQRPPLTTNPSGTADAADDGRDSAASSSASTSTVSTTLDVLPAIRRTASLESGATGSSSSVDQDPLGKGPVTKSKPNRPGLREASSSMVKIDANVAHKEEAAASVESQEDDGDSHEEERDDAAPPNHNGKHERQPDSARDARRD